jgi:hypothetical protein
MLHPAPVSGGIRHVGNDSSDAVFVPFDGIVAVQAGADLLLVRAQVDELRSIRLADDLDRRVVLPCFHIEHAPEGVTQDKGTDNGIERGDVRKGGLQDAEGALCSGFLSDVGIGSRWRESLRVRSAFPAGHCLVTFRYSRGMNAQFPAGGLRASDKSLVVGYGGSGRYTFIRPNCWPGIISLRVTS